MILFRVEYVEVIAMPVRDILFVKIYSMLFVYAVFVISVDKLVGAVRWFV